jgi:hypothetical protein
MSEKSKAFREFHEDAIDRGWVMTGEKADDLAGYTFWESTFERGNRKLTALHNADGMAMIVDGDTGEMIPQADDNASPTNEDWLTALTVDDE